MKIGFIMVLLMLFCFCGKPGIESPTSPINLNHALSLVDSIKVDDERLHFIYIYADAPDYRPVVADQEGISCVDDVGRFMEVLETEICQYGRKDLLSVADGMTRFLLYMSRDDGLWYNFIHADGEINKTYRTSTAEFQWWAVRGLRGLAAAYMILQKYPVDQMLERRVAERLHSMDAHLDSILTNYPVKIETDLGPRPTWLIRNAPDINSELLLVLTKLHGRVDFDYEDEIRKIADGLVEYQYDNAESPLNGMYFCWQNVWHDWGNNQSTALLKVYQITKNEKYLNSVRRWADNFVSFFISSEFPWDITLSTDGSYSMNQFPQIAYGIHSIYGGMKLLFDITGEETYLAKAEKVFSWFSGNNPANTPMYDPSTGRCYDGINSPAEVNFNSGAESTIECLLAIQKRGRF
ncbi:MAG: hypothetical protein J7L22_07825 [Candidatus Marinimicrobia bacterium]|nr:hypothetical protein [Candidatus Neomarinimicrobiota bacterium]